MTYHLLHSESSSLYGNRRKKEVLILIETCIISFRVFDVSLIGQEEMNRYVLMIYTIFLQNLKSIYLEVSRTPQSAHHQHGTGDSASVGGGGQLARVVSGGEGRGGEGGTVDGKGLRYLSDCSVNTRRRIRLWEHRVSPSLPRPLVQVLPFLVSGQH